MAIEVRFVDDKDVGDLENAGFDHLHPVAEVRRQDYNCGVGHRGDLELRLTDADRLEDDLVEPKGTQQADRLPGRERQAAEVSAGSHAADENLRIERMTLHADAVAEDR